METGILNAIGSPEVLEDLQREAATVAYVNNNWLEGVAPTYPDSVTSDSIKISTNAQGAYHWYTYTYPWGYPPATKIRLKLSEVERLRLAAKEDKKLKQILTKFAPHIEITVDFD